MRYKKTALYYFKNKEELFKEIFVHDIENVKNLVVKAVEKKDNPIDKIKTYMISRLNSMEKMQKYFTIFQKDDAAVTYRNFAHKVKEKVIHQEIEFLKNVILDGVQNGIFQIRQREKKRKHFCFLFVIVKNYFLDYFLKFTSDLIFSFLISVMFWLIRTFNGNINIFGLFFGHHS